MSMASIMSPLLEEEKLLIDRDEVWCFDGFSGVFRDAKVDPRQSAATHAVLDHYETALDDLLGGNAELDLKHTQLSPFESNGLSNDGKIYTQGLGEKHRLIFTIVSKEEAGGVKKNIWLLLQHLTNHKYKTCPFFKPGVLKAYLEKNEPALKAALQTVTPPFKEIKSSISFVQKAALTTKRSQYRSLDASKPLTRLSVTQKQVFRLIRDDKKCGVSIINGPGGSGKTLLLGFILKADILKESDDADLPEGVDSVRKRLYVTKFAHLVERTEEALSETLPLHTVSCLTYQALCQPADQADLAAQNSDADSDSRSVFKEWIKEKKGKKGTKEERKFKTDYIQVFNAFKKDTRDPTEEEFLDCLYEEFRVCSSCEKVEEYQETEVRHTLFRKEVALSEAIWEIFLAFKQEFALAAATSVIPDEAETKSKKSGRRRSSATFCEVACPSDEKKYDLIVVDESQQLSPPQVKYLLSCLEDDGKIIFCTDGSQCSDFRLSPLNQLEGVLRRQKAVLGDYQLYNLDEVHRNPKNIAALASQWLKFRRVLIGGVVDPGECRYYLPSPEAEHKHPGKIHWMPSKPQKGKPDAENAEKVWKERFILESGLPSPEVAIVIPDESFREDAEELFKTTYGPCPNIFIKVGGLEYKYIIAYEPFCKSKGEYHPTFRHLNNEIKNGRIEDKQNQVANKHDKSTYTHGNALSKGLVTITRAQEELFVVTDAPEAFCGHLKQEFLKCGSAEMADEAESKVDKEADEADVVKAGAAAKPVDNPKKPDPEAEVAEFEKKAGELEKRGYGKQAASTRNMLKAYRARNLPAEEVKEEQDQKQSEEVKEQQDQKQNLSKAERFYGYVNGLSEKFTPLSLKSLFQRDAEFIRSVFGFEIAGLNFFSHIAKDEGRLDILRTFLDQDKDPQGRISYAELLSDSLTGVLLCAPSRTQGPNENTSALYWLVTTQKGQELLFLLLKRRPSMATEVTAVGLMQRLTPAAGPLQDCSPLYWLATGLPNYKILFKLSNLNPSLLSEITVEGLYSGRSDGSIPGKNNTVLKGLQSCPRGKALLSLLFKKKSGKTEDPAYMILDKIIGFFAANHYKDPEALNTIGEIYYQNAIFHAKDAAMLYKRAFDAFNAASGQNPNPKVLYNLGVCYLNGAGVVSDPVVALEYFNRAADGEDPMALRRLGICYAEGDQRMGIAVNMGTALDFFERATRLDEGGGDGIAERDLALYLMNAKIKNPREILDYTAKGVHFMTLAAEKGDPPAQCELGSYFEDRDPFVSKNLSKATRLFRQSASQNYNNAQYMLGACYIYGKGVEVNFREAFCFFERSAAQKQLNALLVCAIFYEYGCFQEEQCIVKQDLDKARNLYEALINESKSTETGVTESELRKKAENRLRNISKSGNKLDQGLSLRDGDSIKSIDSYLGNMFLRKVNSRGPLRLPAYQRAREIPTTTAKATAQPNKQGRKKKR